jgi:hypothetical protein
MSPTKRNALFFIYKFLPGCLHPSDVSTGLSERQSCGECSRVDSCDTYIKNTLVVPPTLFLDIIIFKEIAREFPNLDFNCKQVRIYPNKTLLYKG